MQIWGPQLVVWRGSDSIIIGRQNVVLEDQQIVDLLDQHGVKLERTQYYSILINIRRGSSVD
ncbi:hypothetical protein Tcan_05955 [Toxocara canis]|uniref:Uncharacterized protein n=1 Tax=Toxocara canis TaxID=6265 RepID=A0A0B2VK27_TOXCA|nr:hypothetical protein Tcan_05955 [Toxocara canis]